MNATVKGGYPPKCAANGNREVDADTAAETLWSGDWTYFRGERWEVVTDEDGVNYWHPAKERLTATG